MVMKGRDHNGGRSFKKKIKEEKEQIERDIKNQEKIDYKDIMNDADKKYKFPLKVIRRN